MDIWQILLDVVILLGVGALFGALLERAKQSAILGYILAGVLLGPNVTHVIRSRDEVLAVSELGVALLLFAIGLEFSWKHLERRGAGILRSGALQVALTTSAGATAAALAGLGAAASFAVGGIVALSSTASVMRVLAVRGELESVHGQRSLGMLLVQDLAVVPLVLVVGVLAEGGTASEMALGVLRTGGIALGLVAALFVVFHRIVPRLLAVRPMYANRELSLLIAVVSGLGSGVVAHAAGVSPALGAFVAGTVLAESPFAVQVRADVASLKTLFLTLFFTAVGMLADPAWILANAGLVAATVAAVLLGKLALVALSLRAFGSSWGSAVATGVCLAQVGEFSFVLADIARDRLLDEDTFLLVISTAVITMMMTPYLVAMAPRLAARLAGRPVMGERDAATDDRPLAVVVGYGPAGRAASERVAEDGLRVTVVDRNPAAAKDARMLGLGALTGDARYAEVLEHAELPAASVVLVTIPDTSAAIDVVRLVRAAAPTARLIVRGRFHRALGELREAGAHIVVDEEYEVGRLVAGACAESDEEAEST